MNQRIQSSANRDRAQRALDKVQQQSTGEEVVGVALFYILTPALLAWGAYQVAMKCLRRRDRLLKEQKYSLYLLLLIELVGSLVGMTNQGLIHSNDYSLKRCQDAHVFSAMLFNLHIFTALFYLYHFKKRVEDPTVSKFWKEMVVLLGLFILSGALSVGAGSFQCGYLEAVAKGISGVRTYGNLMAAWALVVAPVFQYLRFAIAHACQGVLAKAMRARLRMLNYLVAVICLQILVKVLGSIVALFVEYEADVFLVRSVR